MLKYLLLWLPMVVLAILNGLAREAWLARRLSGLRAHQVSTLTGMVLLGLYMGLVLHFWPPVSAPQAVAVGLSWLGLTIAFEFLFGHYVARHSWRRLLQDYNLAAGRLWPLLLAWVALAPWLFYVT